MVEHLFLPGIDLTSITLMPEHEAWLKEWLDLNNSDIEDGNTSSSICLQAAISELVLFQEPQHDWTEMLSAYLTDKDGFPLAYSELYGKRLFKFESQWRQTPVHAVHSHFWLNRLSQASFDAASYRDLIEEFKQSNGWIYNPSVSPTQIRTRMKSELMMSITMGLELLSFCNRLAGHIDEFTTTLVDTPLTPYLASEFFRMRSLEILDSTEQAPIGLGKMILDREIGKGYCDFLASAKVDDYMGTAKRTGRDMGQHSPLSGLQAHYLRKYCDKEEKVQVASRIKMFKDHLADNPLDIPPFQIRDLSIPFGTDISPLEVIAASAIINS